MQEDTVLQLFDVGKHFEFSGNDLQILKNVNITVKKGEMHIIMGPSGSGKSTLLNLVGLLDHPSTGKILLSSNSTSDLDEKQKSELRSKTIGIVFQEFNLFPNLTALENVVLPLLIHKEISKSARELRAKELLDLVGLSHRVNHLPQSMSGGEKQRVAIARALAANPKLLLADEPTGNVDEENEILIIELFKKLTFSGVSVMVVTHNSIYKQYGDYFYKMDAGKLEEVGQKHEIQ